MAAGLIDAMVPEMMHSVITHQRVRFLLDADFPRRGCRPFASREAWPSKYWVSGSKALPEDNSTNQDFLLVNHKSYFSDAAAYLSAQRSFELQPGTSDFVLRAVGLAASREDRESSRIIALRPGVQRGTGPTKNSYTQH